MSCWTRISGLFLFCRVISWDMRYRHVESFVVGTYRSVIKRGYLARPHIWAACLRNYLLYLLCCIRESDVEKPPALLGGQFPRPVPTSRIRSRNQNEPDACNYL
ncbi:hypothetical protein V8C43DRAFT_277829 [Trichoderma afarasin]